MSSGEILAELILDGDDSFQDGMEETSSSMDEAGSSAEDATGGMDEMEQSLIDVDSAGVAAGAAVAGVGGAMQKALGDTQSMRETLGRVSVNMGITSEEANGLARDISNVTFPVEDATATMQSLAEQGVESEEAMMDLATEMDGIADATGHTAEEISNSVGPALRAMGEDIDDVGDHADTFTFIQQETSAELDNFTGLLERFGPQMREAGLSTEDAAAMIAAMEEEGIQGREAMQRLREAADSGAESQEEFAEVIGVSSDGISEQREELDGAKGITDEYAGAANESLTTMDKMSQAFDEIALQAGGLLGPIDALAPVLMSLGAAQSLVAATNFGAVIPSITGVMAALAPLLPIILGVAAVAAALAVAWDKNFLGIRDKTEAAAEVIMSVLGDVSDFLMDIFDTITGIYEDFNPNDIMQDALDDVEDTVDDVMGKIEDLFGDQIDAIIDIFMTFTPAGILYTKRDEIVTAVTSTMSRFEELVSGGLETVMTLYQEFNPLPPVRTTVTDVIGEFTELRDKSLSRVETAVADVIDTLTVFNPVEPVRTTVTDVIGEFTELRDKSLSRVETAVADVITALTVFNPVEPVRTTVTDVIEEFESLKTDGQTAVDDLISDIMMTLRGWGPVSVVSSTVGDVVDEIETLPEEAKQAGKDLMREFAQGIKDAASAPVDAVEEAVDEVRGFLPDSPAEEGPLSDLDDTGPGFIQEIVTGMQSEQSVLAQEAEETASTLEMDLPGVLEGLEAPALEDVRVEPDLQSLETAALEDLQVQVEPDVQDQETAALEDLQVEPDIQVQGQTGDGVLEGRTRSALESLAEDLREALEQTDRTDDILEELRSVRQALTQISGDVIMDGQRVGKTMEQSRDRKQRHWEVTE